MMRRQSKKLSSDASSPQNSEELYRALFDQATDGIFVANAEGQYVEVNQRGCEMLGYTREEMLRLFMQDLIPPEDMASDPPLIGDLQSGNRLLKERRLRCKDGRLLPIEISARMLADGSFLGMVRDISVRRQTEQELQQSKDLLQAIIEAAPIAIIGLDLDGNVHNVWNPAAERMLGWSADEVWGRPLPSVSLESQEEFRRFREQIRNGLSLDGVEVNRQRRDGGSIDYSIYASALHDSEGQISGNVAVLVDITERKQAEEERQAHLRFLESLDRVNRAMQGTNDLDEMMRDVLDTMLSVFECDRAWLVHPCDPDAMTWRTPMERTRPEYPGVLPIGVELPLDPVGAAVFRVLRNADGPVQFGPGSEHDVPQEISKAFSVKSFIATVLYPKLELPWSFGLHQCSYARVWTPQEERLLQEIGRRLADALSSLLAYRRLHESEHRLIQAEHMAHVGWWDRDYGARSVSLSGEACRIFGLPVDAQESYDLDQWHERWQELVHPEDRPRAAEAAAAALQGGPHYDIEYRVIQPSGDMRIVHSRGEVMWDESGQPLRMFGIMHDITQLRQAEQEHRDSEARFRVFVDHAADGFFLHDEDGNVLDVNRRACESMGYSREELIRMSPREFDVDMDDSFLGEMRERLDAGEVVTINTRHRRKDGSVFPVEVRARPFWVGNQRYGVSLVRDVTERLQAEAALRQRESQLQLVIDTVPEGVILLDATGMMYLTNPVADQYLEILDPDREAGHITHLGQRALKEFLTSPPEGLWHEIAYEAHIYEAIARPVENTIRNSGWVLVLRDITRERDIQRRVQRQERLAAVGQLAAGIAHDFNNILAVIKLYAQFISKTVEMPSRAHERLTTIEQQVGQASALIQQILDFSRLSVLERRPLNLLPFLEELVTLLGRTLPEHIQVEFAHTVGPHLIRADPTRLQQVMMNLAVNARDSMPEGGRLVIRLTHMHTEERKSMCIQDLPPGDWVLVEVTDSGGGIPAEVLNHIFEPFFTTKEVGEGTGLGLSQVYGIVQQHEGYVDVITGIGNGTSFLLYFPVLRSNEMVTGVSAGASVQLGQGQKVLLVEDNPIMREALLDSLKLLNYEVVAASNGREALAILETMAEEITLVLSDVVMPVMGGTALFYAIRDKDLDIPVVLLTGHPLAKEMDELQSIGLAGWLPKPPDLQTLSSLLEKIVPR